MQCVPHLTSSNVIFSLYLSFEGEEAVRSFLIVDMVNLDPWLKNDVVMKTLTLCQSNLLQ